MLLSLRPPHRLSVCCRSFCRAVLQPDMEIYKEAFARRMAMAGIKPHHRIALGVSGGPDSMALCVLTATWKSCGLVGKSDNSGYIDGLLGIVVDHRLRPESTEEANLVCARVLKLGVQCQIASCDWSDGRPTRGHVQEAAREMRYQIFQDVCSESGIGILLVAHHADDQAELFILRLSRNSGVLGLAGMAFVSQSFPSRSSRNGILIVRPLLPFSKDDMYKICAGGSHEWVEDPSNQSPLYARNRIRLALTKLSSSGARHSDATFKSELQALISGCRATRAYVDQVCRSLIQQCVALLDHGYVVIDSTKLDPSNVDDLCLSKFLAVVLQFVSQRHKPLRGAASELLLHYVRRVPCKTCLTVAGCYLAPVPKSKGAKVMVTAAFDPPRPSSTRSSEQPCFPSDEIDEIISASQPLHSSGQPPFLKSTSPESTLAEAKRLGIISESTSDRILALQKEEYDDFYKASPPSKVKRRTKVDINPTVELRPGESCHFMDRFVVTWELCGHDVAFIRRVADEDWLYLADLSTGRQECSEHAQMSARRALRELKSIPAPARRGLPVLVNAQGLPLCIPNIRFSECPEIKLTARFEPRVPLGGGYSSFQ